MNIYFLVCNVIVSAYNQFGVFLFQVVQVRIKLVQPYIFKTLPFITTGTGRKIGIDQPYITKIELNNTAFIITYFMSRSIFYMVRFYFSKYSYTTVSFFLSAEPIVFVAEIIKEFMIHIIFCGFCFLNTDDIGRIGFYPFYKSFVDSRTNTIQVITDNAHW